jgi:hypothetical protein
MMVAGRTGKVDILSHLANDSLVILFQLLIHVNELLKVCVFLSSVTRTKTR